MEEESVIGLYLYIVVLYVRKVNFMLSYIALNVNEKTVRSRYEVTFFNYKMTLLIMRKCIVFHACGEVKVQKYFLCLSGVVHVVQYFKRSYILRNYYLIL